MCLSLEVSAHTFFCKETLFPRREQGREWKGGAFAGVGYTFQGTADMGDTIL